MKTILVIEENESIRENLTEWLELDNYKIASTANGSAGITLARELLPDLIICNIRMDGISGYEVLLSIASTPITSKIPFIFSTSRSENKDKVKALHLGADDYLVKPYEMETLSMMANTWIKSGSLRFQLH